MIDRTVFSRELMHWGGHTTVCATPSFILALLAGFNAPAHIVAMLCGVATMVVLYALISSHPSFASRRDGTLSMAARYGARTRSVMCLLEIPLLVLAPPAVWIFLLPDMMAGMAALHVAGLASAVDSGAGASASFVQVYAATVIEAGFVSGSIFSLFSGGILVVKALVKLTRARQQVLGSSGHSV